MKPRTQFGASRSRGVKPCARVGGVIEALEERRLLSANWQGYPPTGSLDSGAVVVPLRAASTVGPAQAYSTELTVDQVKVILAQAASQAKDGQVICVADRDGNILGLMQKGAGGTVQQQTFRKIKAIDEAVTAAFFESTQDAFTTRTARFIIQDHFPQPLPNTPGGPLYGVEFSSQPGSDVFGKTAFSISGDPGGVPLFVNGVPVGGIGVSGDGVDVAPRADVFIKGDTDLTGKVFDGNEEKDFDEAVALAGAQGFMAPDAIRADKIFVGGLRLPFAAEDAASAKPSLSYRYLTHSGSAALLTYTTMADGSLHAGSRAFARTTFDGFSGEVRDPVTSGAAVDGKGTRLTATDVHQIIDAAVTQALGTRAAIREPIGVPASVHVCVVDLQGNRIGSFRMDDGTNFSYDVAVQKARTAAFFSSDASAFSTRAVGFLSQRFFPPGIGHSSRGPLYHLQNDLSGLNPMTLTPGTPKFAGVLQNGITIFPGGFPLYKNGKLVGAIGISGDGVDQDDLIGYAGTAGFRPSKTILSDHLNDSQVYEAMRPKLSALASVNGVNAALIGGARRSLRAGLNGVQLPYVKFPRNPGV